MSSLQTSTISEEPKKLTRKDFVSGADVRWCPGCGDYAVLAAAQKVFPELGIPKENFVIVSGIGCSSRFPYYMDTYGFHTIHGRAPAFATGIKVANPELSVWVITGDGDGLSIGGNHLLHTLRRNVDITILLFNNRIYGLTKGQYSPTSLQGHKTKTSPMGSVETPLNPLCFALTAEATFVARTMDANPKHMYEVFIAAAQHKGTSFVEIYQNCVIFNNNTFKDVSGRDVRDDQLLMMEHDKPLLFGQGLKKGISLRGTKPHIVTIGEDGVTEADIVVHNAHDPNPSYAYMLSQMSYPNHPTPMGILKSIDGRQTYEDSLSSQVRGALAKKGEGSIHNLLLGTEFWVHKKDSQKPQVTVAAQDALKPYDEELNIMSELQADATRLKEDPLLAILREPIETAFQKYGTTKNCFLAPHESINDAIQKFKISGVDCVLVVDNDKCVGLVTERDILLKVALKKMDRDTTPVLSLVDGKPEKAKLSATIGYAINKLSLSGYRHLPITSGENNKVVGVLSIKHILAYIYTKVSAKETSENT